MGWQDAPVAGSNWQAAPLAEPPPQATLPENFATMSPQAQEQARYDATAVRREGALHQAKSLPLGFAQLVTRGMQFLSGATGQAGMGAEAQSMRNATDQAVSTGEATYQKGRADRGQSGIDWDRIAGGTLATLPLAMAMPGAGAAGFFPKVASSAATGGMVGALEPVDTTKGDFWSQKGQQVGAGTGMGGITGALGYGLSKLIAPSATTNPDVQLLRNEGVTPTVGQTAGGVTRSFEEKATSIPFVGDAIKMGETRAVGDFNRAAYNRALYPLGESWPKDSPIGREGIGQLGERVSKAFDDVVPKLTSKVDAKFSGDLQSLDELAQNMVGPRYEQFTKIINNEIARKISPNGTITGESAQEMQSTLGRLASQFRNSSDADQRLLGNALREAQSTVLDLVERVNPANAGELQAAKSAYANFLRVERAAGMQGAEKTGGVFSPAQLNSAVRAMDKTLHHRAYAEGNALMQDLSGAGQRVLTSNIPDSGTAGRAMVGTLPFLLGGGAIHPGLAMGALPSLAYTPWGQRLASGLVAGSPESRAAVAELLAKLAPMFAVGGAGLATRP